MCSNCHQCGARLRCVLDGEEWCPQCQQYRRYISHGWSPGCATSTDRVPCPPTQKDAVCLTSTSAPTVPSSTTASVRWCVADRR